jgi:ATP-dependent DNA helicase PIF1
MTLTKKQQHALDLMNGGKNILLSGPAGCGKSHVIETFFNTFQKNRSDEKIVKTAMTGAAAVLINGRTLHSFLGIGLGKGDVGQLISIINKNKKALANWKNTSVLIIDEVSMLSAELFEKLEGVARVLRNNNGPFGGIQLVLSGDFYQLPVIGGNFIFLSNCFKNVMNQVVLLTKNIRQRKDAVFAKCLAQIRLGLLTPECEKLLTSRMMSNMDNDQISEFNKQNPVKLFSRIRDVDLLNSSEMSKILNVDDGLTYCADVGFSLIPDYKKEMVKKTFFKNSNCLESIELAVGARVIVTANFKDKILDNCNIERRIVNGTQGVVYRTTGDCVYIQLMNDLKSIVPIKKHVWYEYYSLDQKEFICVEQIPLMLGWAMTIHKSQGMSLKYVETDVGSSIFEMGQAYVVLSRVHTLDGLMLRDFDQRSIKANPIVGQFYKDIVGLNQQLNKN